MVPFKPLSGQSSVIGQLIAIGGSVEGVKTSAEGYLAPTVIAVLNMIVLTTGKDLLLCLDYKLEFKGAINIG